MLLEEKNEDGYVKAYISFYVVDKNNVMGKDGEYVFINGFWVHEDHRDDMKKILSRFIKIMAAHEETQQVAWVYWERSKNGKYVRFPAWKFLRRFNKLGENNG